MREMVWPICTYQIYMHLHDMVHMIYNVYIY